MPCKPPSKMFRTFPEHSCNKLSITPMAESPLQALEGKIDELIGLCAELNRENQQLKADNAGWQQEKQDLIDQNELARGKVEAMIDRLRSTE